MLVLRTGNLFASCPANKNATSKYHTNRKCLFPSKNEDDIVRKENDDLTTQNPQTDSDKLLSKLNIDGLKTCEGRSCLKMKVLLVHPNGNVVTRNPTNEKTVQIIRNLFVGGWTAVANAVFDHSNETFQQELRLALQRKVNKEFLQRVIAKLIQFFKQQLPMNWSHFLTNLLSLKQKFIALFGTQA